MVLESLINPLKAESHPSALFLHGFLYASIGLLLGLWIFNEHSSLIMVFLTTFAATPLIYSIIKLEEKKDLTDMPEKKLLKEHGKALMVFMLYFLGATISFAFWYLVLPKFISGPLLRDAFKVQIETILVIRGSATGDVLQRLSVFSAILANNLKVLIFCIIFSFLYGLGAIFILTWNASVIGVAIGETIKTGISEIGKGLNLTTSTQFFGVVSYGLLRYSIHGIPEILAYFVAGLGGGIISTAVIRHDFGTKSFEKIVLDSAVLLLISLALVVGAAFLEVFVTPLIF